MSSIETRKKNKGGNKDGRDNEVINNLRHEYENLVTTEKLESPGKGVRPGTRSSLREAAPPETKYRLLMKTTPSMAKLAMEVFPILRIGSART